MLLLLSPSELFLPFFIDRQDVAWSEARTELSTIAWLVWWSVNDRVIVELPILTGEFSGILGSIWVLKCEEESPVATADTSLFLPCFV